MTYSDYKQGIIITEQALDLLDIKQFLLHGKEVYEVMHMIEDYIGDGDGRDIWEVEKFMNDYPQIFGSPPDIFNCMTHDEFMEYCQKRYPEITWVYEYIERYWVR